MKDIVFRPILPPVLIGVLFVAGLCCLWLILRNVRDTKRERFLTMVRMFLIMLLAFIINLRPMREQTDVMVTMKNMDVLFVVDSTISMWAEDYGSGYSNARMNGVQKDCDYIIEELAGGNLGLIRFDNMSQVLAPFTQDATNVRDAFSTITAPDELYARGSNLNVPYEDMEELLISSSKKEDRKTYVFFISDGEITDGSALRSYAELKKYITGGAVLGYGTAEGGNMKKTGSYSSGYIKDEETWENAVSVIDEGNLEKIAQDLGIDYIHMDDSHKVDGVLSRIIMEATDITGKSKSATTYEDLYWYLTIPLLGVGLWELVEFLRKGKNL